MFKLNPKRPNQECFSPNALITLARRLYIHTYTYIHIYIYIYIYIYIIYIHTYALTLRPPLPAQGLTNGDMEDDMLDAHLNELLQYVA